MRISDWSSDVCSSDLRERGHIAAISAWADGDWAGYKRRLDLVAAEHPRDLLAIQAGHLSDFYHGDRETLRGRIARALPSWTADMPGNSYVMGIDRKSPPLNSSH